MTSDANERWNPMTGHAARITKRFHGDARQPLLYDASECGGATKHRQVVNQESAMPRQSLHPPAAALPALGAGLRECSVSGLSSGAFMTVQLHLAHSALFVGAGVIAGGPCRCVESFPGAAPLPEDAFVQNALFICMNPLTPSVGPQPEHLARLAVQMAGDGLIDPLHHLQDQRLYIFTGSEDKVVNPSVVQATRSFYRLLGVKPENLKFVDTVPAGHAILTTRLEDNPLATNAPPYINRQPGDRMQSWDILDHIYPDLLPAAEQPGGRLLRFDQREFFSAASRSSMSAYGYVYVPLAVLQGEPCRRVHVALHGCKQGANHVNIVNGRRDSSNEPPYGDRYYATTGYNEKADPNHIVVLYPQVEGVDDGFTQNPEGCWDWWGYSSASTTQPDYYSKNAVQISAIHQMLQRLGAD
jgi:poly(3-hydroxybutyrate) depolymerase